MGVTSSNKQIDHDRIDCNGMLKVTLVLSAAPPSSDEPKTLLMWNFFFENPA